MDKAAPDDGFWSLELANGQMLRIPRELLDRDTLLPDDMFDMSKLEEQMKTVEVIPKERAKPDPPPPSTHRTQIITETLLNRPGKKWQPSTGVRLSFDYEAFHRDLVEQRKEDSDTADLAVKARMRRLSAIQTRIGWV
jgi:hypothetical protein